MLRALTDEERATWECENGDCADPEPPDVQTEGGEAYHLACCPDPVGPVTAERWDLRLGVELLYGDGTGLTAEEAVDLFLAAVRAGQDPPEVDARNHQADHRGFDVRPLLRAIVVGGTLACPRCGRQVFSYQEGHPSTRTMNWDENQDGRLAFHGNFEWFDGDDDPGVVCDDGDGVGCGASLTLPDGWEVDFT